MQRTGSVKGDPVVILGLGLSVVRKEPRDHGPNRVIAQADVEASLRALGLKASECDMNAFETHRALPALAGPLCEALYHALSLYPRQVEWLKDCLALSHQLVSDYEQNPQAFGVILRHLAEARGWNRTRMAQELNLRLPQVTALYRGLYSQMEVNTGFANLCSRTMMLTVSEQRELYGAQVLVALDPLAWVGRTTPYARFLPYLHGGEEKGIPRHSVCAPLQSPFLPKVVREGNDIVDQVLALPDKIVRELVHEVVEARLGTTWYMSVHTIVVGSGITADSFLRFMNGEAINPPSFVY